MCCVALAFALPLGACAQTPGKAAMPTTTTATASSVGAAPTVQEAPTKSRQYQGRRIDLDFSAVDIRVLLRIIADFAGKDIHIAPGIEGDVSARFSAPWDKVLDQVAVRHGLLVRIQGNRIYISSVNK